MADRDLWLDSYGLDHIASALATQEAFESAVEATQSDVMVTEACKMVTQQGMLDMSLVLLPGEAEETVGEHYTSRGLKYYDNKWPYTKYHYSLYLREGFMQEAEIRGKDLARKAIQLAAKQARAAQTRLAWIITNGQTAASVPAYVDDETGNALFDNSHEYGSSTYDNNETVSTITAAGNIETNEANLIAAVSAWIQAPDTDGNAGGFGNSLDNILVLCSANLWTVMESLTKNSVLLSSAGNTFGPRTQGIPYVVVPGLNDDTVVLTRKPSDPVAGFYWGLDPWIHSASKQPDADWSTYKWTYARKWVVAPSTPQAVYYIGS